MLIRYDTNVDAASLYFAERASGFVKYNITVDRDDLINLGFDSDEKLVRLEILSASKRIPEVLAKTREPSEARISFKYDEKRDLLEITFVSSLGGAEVYQHKCPDKPIELMFRKPGRELVALSIRDASQQLHESWLREHAG